MTSEPFRITQAVFTELPVRGGSHWYFLELSNADGVTGLAEFSYGVNSIAVARSIAQMVEELRDEEITYIADNPFFLDVAFGIYWGSGIRSITTLLEPVVEFGECVGNPWGATVVYRVPQHLGDQ